MMLRTMHFAPGAVVCYTAAVTVLAILPLRVAPAQDAKNNKRVVKQHEGDSPKFDVLVNRSDGRKKSGDGKPVAIAITFADGSTQKVDISKYGFVTIDIDGRRVKMHPAGKPPKSFADPMSAHIPHAASDAPVRIPLPKGFAPDKGPIVDKLESRNKTTKKKVDNRDKTKNRNDDDRLDRLEAMLHDLQKQMKSLRAKNKGRN